MNLKEIGRSVVVATAMGVLSIVGTGCLGGTHDDVVDELSTEHPALTEQQCKKGGGDVVYDIGNGAIHRADYVCPSGKPALGAIKYTPPEPMPIEGAVCCPRAAN